ncbi:MAG: aldose 1-epimerase family protein [Candidatus Dormibacteria bacterium]
MSRSGRQFTLRFQDQAAVITEVGATLREYRAAGRPLIDGFLATERSRDGRGQVLLPWPNRIDGGKYRFAGADQQLPLNEVEHGNAIHGLARWVPWTLQEVSDSSVTLSLVIAPQPGYDHILVSKVEYRLSDLGLTAKVQATNRGQEEIPFGVGFHPYLLIPGSPVDGLDLLVPATLRFQADARGIPLGDPVVVAGSEFDFTARRRIGRVQLDTTFTGLVRSEAGMAEVRLTDRTSQRGVRLWCDQSLPYLQVFTGDTLADPTVRRRSLAVEPMSCPPNAFRSGRDLVILEPGASYSASWGLAAI